MTQVTQEMIAQVKRLKMPFLLERGRDAGQFRYNLAGVWSPWFPSFGDAIANLCALGSLGRSGE